MAAKVVGSRWPYSPTTDNKRLMGSTPNSRVMDTIVHQQHTTETIMVGGGGVSYGAARECQQKTMQRRLGFAHNGKGMTMAVIMTTTHDDRDGGRWCNGVG
ncbi:hypothetical protein V6N13_125399 [Hibiscus sabdariffa]